MRKSSRLIYLEHPRKACDTPKTNSGNSQAIIGYCKEKVPQSWERPRRKTYLGWASLLSCEDPKVKLTSPLAPCEVYWSSNTNAQRTHEGQKNGDHN
ncbi:hypothetical protein ACFX2J_034451 [Malus domestica]